MAFQLLIARGNGEGQQFVVVQTVVRIGRDDDNDVVLSDAGVSRQHTRIFEKQGRYFAEDLGSANGTLVNGERVAAPRELKTGDALGIGAALINFVELDDPRKKSVPNVPVAGKAVTGEHPILSRAGMLPPPPSAPQAHELVTASGEEHLNSPRLFSDDGEVTAPVGRALAFGPDDSTQPVGKPLPFEPPLAAPVRKHLEPDAPRSLGVTLVPEDVFKRAPPPEPQTDLGVPRQLEPEMRSGPSLVPASMLKRAPDVSDQLTSLALPDLGPAPIPPPPHLEGPTRIKLVSTPGVEGINKLLVDDRGTVESSDNSLAPLDLSRSDLQALNDATRADARPLVIEESSPGVPALPARPEGRVTNALPLRETAADRARRRRIASDSLGAQLAMWWGELPLKTRAIAAAVAGLIFSMVVIGLVQFFGPDPSKALPPEPDRLLVTRERIRYFFGLGDGVDYTRADSKEFVFDFVTPTDAAVLMHYVAQEIDRDEVAIYVNGNDIGFVSPDIGVPDRELETLISQRVLRRGEKNTILFDNVRNPPSKDRWRVGEIWIEVLPVPPSSPADAIRRGKELAKQAGQLYAQRDVGSENVFRSWRAYRQAWQILLVVPEEQRTSLFDQMRRKADDIGQELDRQCGALMLEAKKQMELKNPEKAKEILDGVSQYFPTNEHRCHALAKERLDEYEF